MKSKLKILWIEDEETFYDDERSLIEDYFGEELGITFDFVRPAGATIDETLESTHQFDLVFSDLDLSTLKKDLTGTKVIKALRRKNKFVDILFYSMKAIDPDKELMREGGIFITNRNNFRSDVRGLVSYYASKVFDMSRARGEVASYVAEFDHIQNLILMQMFRKEAAAVELFKAHMVEDLTKDLSERREKKEVEVVKSLEKLDDGDLKKYLSRIGSERRRRAVLRLYDHLGEKVAGYPKEEWDEIIKNFFDKVLDTRNRMSHCRIEQKEGKAVLIDSLNGDVEIEYGLKTLIDIAKDLEYYERFFSSLHDRIVGK